MGIGSTIKDSAKEFIHDLFFKYRAWTIVSVGLMLLLLQFADVPRLCVQLFFEPNEDGIYAKSDVARIETLWTTTTSAILGGCFFAVLLKSFQFTGIFRDELLEIVNGEDIKRPLRKEISYVLSEVIHDRLLNLVGSEEVRKPLREELSDIVFGHDFLRRWQGIETLWTKVSSALFENIYPELHRELKETFLESYLPVGDQEYFIDGYTVRFNLDRHSNRDFLVFTEQVEFKIVAANKGVKCPVRFRTDYPEPESSAPTSFEIRKLQVDGSDRSGDIKHKKVKVDGFRRVQKSYEFEVTGKESYTVERDIYRVIPFRDEKDGQTRSVWFNRFVRGMKIEVTHSDDLDVFVLKKGTIRDLESETTGFAKIKKTYNGLVLPHQGFQLHWLERGNSNV